MKYRVIILLFIVLNTLSCRQMRELNTLSKCQFRMKSVTEVQLANVMLENKQSLQQLNIMQIASLTQAFINGNLPFMFTVNVEVKNPNATVAALNKIEWIALVDEFEVAHGTITQRVEIQPNATEILPIKISTELLSILGNVAKDKAFGFGFKLDEGEGKQTRVSLKIKPSVMIGNRNISSPAFFTITKEFTIQQ